MIDAQIKGLIEAQRNIEQAIADLKGKPMLDAMRDSLLIVQRDAKILSPVDTGRLRASITPEIRSRRENVIVGVVGSNVMYAPYMELGTRPHWPPIRALEVWARRHGTNAFLVARAISRRGTRPRRYLQRSFTQNQGRIIARFEKAVKEIAAKAND